MMKPGSMVAAAALALAVGVGGAAWATPLAMPAGPFAAAAAGTSLIEQAQFVVGGRNYCFYPDGWHGPGWYWCGYALRRGLGWGGAEGWRGWHRDGRHEERHHDDHHEEHHDSGRHHH